MKLRTFKDIENKKFLELKDMGFHDIDGDPDFIKVQDLREEAIKWIKCYYGQLNVGTETQIKGKKITIQFKGKYSKDDCLIIGKILSLLTMFNLTMEDLR